MSFIASSTPLPRGVTTSRVCSLRLFVVPVLAVSFAQMLLAPRSQGRVCGPSTKDAAVPTNIFSECLLSYTQSTCYVFPAKVHRKSNRFETRVSLQQCGEGYLFRLLPLSASPKTVITVLLRDLIAQILNSCASSGVSVAQSQPEPICCVLGKNLGVSPVVTGRAVIASGWALRRSSALFLPFCRLSL